MGSLQFPNMGMGLRLAAFGRRSSAINRKSLRKVAKLANRPGARFSKAPETFRARKAIFSSSVSKNREV